MASTLSMSKNEKEIKYMFDLKLLNKVSEVEAKTGQSLPLILSKVPFGNVVTALKVIPVENLIKMVSSVSFDKLVDGLTIITPKEIESVTPDKLLNVLTNGNMKTVRLLQNKYSDDDIIKSLVTLSNEDLSKILIEDNFDVICNVIDNICGIIDN